MQQHFFIMQKKNWDLHFFFSHIKFVLKQLAGGFGQYKSTDFICFFFLLFSYKTKCRPPE